MNNNYLKIDFNSMFFISEIGGNFNNYDEAIRLINLSKECGFQAVKFQSFRADTLTSKKAIFEMENTGHILQYDHFKKYELSESLTSEVIAYCKEIGLIVFSTPSHPSDVDLLEKFDLPLHKIGSDDAVNIPLLKYIAKTGKTIILSTGMCTLSEVQRSVDAILEEGNDKIVLLHCTTNYPTHPESVNLNAMVTMQKHFSGIPVGYSDHTLGIDTCYAAAVLGAKVLEFHFTYDKNADGPDH
ncbi:MAG: N-acetylneuraminate synthase family protein, partial [Nanoarchaeota archaeon]|nr:N-acetylneuraminate synthase family protein [Nanoarchaeota archaeon]